MRTSRSTRKRSRRIGMKGNERTLKRLQRIELGERGSRKT